jgi:hypothetical protein
MNPTSIRVTGLALLGVAALALLVAPIHARAAADVTDRHEIPTFVRDRVEIAAGVERIG